MTSRVYLTIDKDSNIREQISDRKSALIIPNFEIKESFEQTILKWFNDRAKSIDRSRLFNVVWSGDSETLAKEMNVLLRQSYHDYREVFYHAFLAGIFAGAGYMVESNKEHGEGRSDVIVYDMVGGKVAIFEQMKSYILENTTIDEKTFNKNRNKDWYLSSDELLKYGIIDSIITDMGTIM